MNETSIEKRKRFITNITFWTLVLVLAYLVLEYAITWVMPFLLGFLVALAFQPLVRFCAKHTKLNKQFCAFVIVLLGYFLVGTLLWKCGASIVESVKHFCMNLPAFFSAEISPFLSAANNGLLDFLQWVVPDMAQQMEGVLAGMLTNLQETLATFSTNMLASLAEVSSRLPLWLISFIFTILSSLFISMDYDRVIAFIARQIPEKNRAFLRDIRSYLKTTIISYLRAYLILMGITFLELSVGLLILRVHNPFGIAAIIAITDVLPILGTGTIVLPWALISLLQQRYYLAIGLLVLYLIVTAFRHFIEPKVVGDQLGIPPIVAIVCIYLGFVWFGVLGAIGFPVAANILISLHKAGKIHIWN